VWQPKQREEKIVCYVGFVWTCRHRLKYIKTGDGMLVYCYNKKQAQIIYV